jgi:beta-phosphoglucomutase family hydrolase
MTGLPFPVVNGLPERIRAALFDLDGVLTPTAAIHAAAWAEMFDAYLLERDGPGYRPFDPVGDYAEYVDGRARADGTRTFLASRGITLPEGSSGDPAEADTVEGLSERKDEIFRRRLAERGAQPYPGSLRYLRAVRAAGLRTAVVSASRHCAQIVAAAGLTELFDARVDGLDAARDRLHGKPAPDTFLAAARRLNTIPAQAAVYEDAIAGVAAGRAGRFGYVVGVDRSAEADERLPGRRSDKLRGAERGRHAADLRAHGADVVVRDLAELLDEEGGA